MNEREFFKGLYDYVYSNEYAIMDNLKLKKDGIHYYVFPFHVNKCSLDAGSVIYRRNIKIPEAAKVFFELMRRTVNQSTSLIFIIQDIKYKYNYKGIFDLTNGLFFEFNEYGKLNYNKEEVK